MNQDKELRQLKRDLHKIGREAEAEFRKKYPDLITDNPRETGLFHPGLYLTVSEFADIYKQTVNMMTAKQKKKFLKLINENEKRKTKTTTRPKV